MKLAAFLTAVLYVLSIFLKNVCNFDAVGIPNEILRYAAERLVVIIAFALPYAVYFVFSKNNKRQKIRIPSKYPLWALFFATMLCAMLLSIAEGIISLLLGIETGSSDIFSMQTDIMAVSLFITVFIVPVVEEFIFREVLLSILSPFGALFSAILSSVLFAAVHSAGSILYAFVWGMLLSHLSQTKGIKYSIALHILNNALNVVFASVSERIGLPFKPVYFVVVLITGAVSIAVILKTHFSKRRGGNG